MFMGEEVHGVGVVSDVIGFLLVLLLFFHWRIRAERKNR
jgi:hypothetical protein